MPLAAGAPPTTARPQVLQLPGPLASAPSGFGPSGFPGRAARSHHPPDAASASWRRLSRRHPSACGAEGARPGQSFQAAAPGQHPVPPALAASGPGASAAVTAPRGLGGASRASVPQGRPASPPPAALPSGAVRAVAQIRARIEASNCPRTGQAFPHTSWDGLRATWAARKRMCSGQAAVSRGGPCRPGEAGPAPTHLRGFLGQGTPPRYLS